MKNTLSYMVFFLALFLVACGDDQVQEKSTRVSGISNVLMHEPNNFTFLVPNGGNKIGQLRINVYSRNNVRLIRDLKEDELIHIEIFCPASMGGLKACSPIPVEFYNWNIDARELIIHLHSAKEINGAGGQRSSGKSTTRSQVIPGAF